jgi:hypothetical protein
MAGAASYNDFGLNFVRQIHKLAGVPYPATSWELRGFSWWIGDFRQRIWAELGVGDDEDSMMYKICTATDFVHEVDANSTDLIDKVAAEGRPASTSALIFDPRERTLRHWTTVTVHEGIGNWVLPLVIGSAYAQLAAVNSVRDDVEQMFGGKCHHNNRPMRGPDSCTHDRVNGWHTECAEEGRNDSAWVGTGEFAEAVALLRSADVVATLANEALTAEFPFAAGSSTGVATRNGPAGSVRFAMDTNAPHSVYGNGLSTRLDLPLSLPNELAERLCATLNLLETREFTRSCLLGSWCVDNGGIAFMSFVPNILYVPGMALNLALAADARTQWVAAKLGNGNREHAASVLAESTLPASIRSNRPTEAAEPVKPRRSGFLQAFLR